MKNGIDKGLEKYIKSPTNFPDKIIVHHTGGSDADPKADTSNHTFEMVKKFHKSKGWDTIGYHVFIEKDGTVYQGRPFEMHGAHCVGQNKSSIGVCLSGNFDSTMPTEAQISSLRDVLKQIKSKYVIKEIVPHRKYANKTCYGNNLSDTWASDLLTSFCSLKDFTLQELFTEILDRIKDIK